MILVQMVASRQKECEHERREQVFVRMVRMHLMKVADAWNQTSSTSIEASDGSNPWQRIDNYKYCTMRQHTARKRRTLMCTG